jgi:hypothetical protein
MAKIYRYSYVDDNANNITRTHEGDRYEIYSVSVCPTGAIVIFDGINEVSRSCYAVGSLTITPLDSAPTTSAYDCVNGGCVPRQTYNTPGKYATLAACNAGCAKDSPCNGECVESAEIAQLNQLADQIRAKYCG